jgi:energy-coupling factor transporter ATP-binding protein EcfA2
MGKFNIRKATGRTSSYEPSMSVEHPIEGENILPKQNQLEGFSDDKNLAKGFELFDTIVSHNYLNKLTTYPIVAAASLSTSKMGWYKITRIVYDGNTFFPDQLSMLYTALHNVARNVALVIEKKGLDDIEIYLGARDFDGNLHEASTLLNSAIQGYLPGIKTEASDKHFCTDKKDCYVASYSGVASLRDNKKETFVQGIEKFIDATPLIPTYTALFIADNVGVNQANDIMKAYSCLLDAISPFIQYQESINESETEGLSHTLTKTLGETITNTLSETVTRTEGTNESYSSNTSSNSTSTENSSPNIFNAFFTKIFGGKSGESKSYSFGSQESKQFGSHNDFSKANGTSQAKAIQKQDSEAEGVNSSKTIGFTKQITQTNSFAKRYVNLLERHIERIQNGLPFGLWSVCTYFVSLDESTSKKLANIYRGCITGEESDLDSTAVNIWDKTDSKKLIGYLKQTQNPRFSVENINVSGGEVVTSKELAIHMSLPQTSIPGVEIRESAVFGRNINGRKSTNNTSNDYIKLGVISHLGNPSKKKVLLNINELNQHVFVTGSTGSGKSNTVYLLINELMNKGKKVLIVEPTKGDYRKVFGGKKDVTVYSTRENERNLLRINPFAFPNGIQVVEHVERLVDIFGVCWPMYAAMPAVLKQSILSAYSSSGWNLRTSICRHGKLFPTISDVVIQLKRIIESSEYSSDTKGDYIGALQTRLESLQNGIYSTIFSSSECIEYSKLYDENAIIDLHHVGSTETRSLLMAMIVLGLNEWRMSVNEDEMDLSLQHVTVLEEAHNILPRVSKQQSQEGSNVLGKSVEMIADVMARIRTYGEGFIIVDQSPSAIDESAIRNTNTKIVMNLPDGEDRMIAGKSVALTKEKQISELSRLSTGEAVVWQRGWSEAVLTLVDKMSIRTPLKSKDNMTAIRSDSVNKPTSLFTKRFIKKIELSTEENHKLEVELLHATAPSSIKSTLLDSINNVATRNESIVRDAVINYLSINKKLIYLLEYFNFKASSQFILELRDFMSTDLDIIDTEDQNKLLSMAFIWAAKQDSKWHDICAKCINFKNND